MNLGKKTMSDQKSLRMSAELCREGVSFLKACARMENSFDEASGDVGSRSGFPMSLGCPHEKTVALDTYS